jgi:uncharacterized protein (TIGR03437 family)
VGGVTTAPDFPLINPIQNQIGGGFLTKLSPQGNSLVYSTLFDGAILDLTLDSSGNIYASGNTATPDFPVLNSPFQRHPSGGSDYDAFAIKVAPAGNTLLYSVAFGGAGPDLANAIAVDSTGAAFVAGYTESSDFPTKSAYQATYGRGGDMFLIKLAPDTVTPPPPALTLSPSLLRFTATAGATAALTQAITPAVASGSAATGYSLAIVDAQSHTWLTATPAQSATLTPFNVSANPSGLAAGTYTGTVRVTPSNSGTPIDLPVTLVIQAVPPVLTSADPVLIAPGSPDTTVTLTGTGFVDGAKVSMALYDITGLALTTTFVNATTLQATIPSVYLALANTLTLTATNPGSAVSNPINITVGNPVPAIISDKIYGSASGLTTSIAPGELITIMGVNIGPNRPLTLALSAPNQVATSLGGTRVLFDGVAAPMVYTSAFQINAIVPFSLAGHAVTHLQVEYLGTASTPVELSVAAVAPGIFTADSSGHGQGAILNQDFSANSSTNPAAAGSIVSIYATGGGVTSPASADGAITQSDLGVPLLPVAVTIDGQPADVLWAGAAPNLVAGVLQVNVRIPSSARSGNAAVSMQIGTAQSQAGVTIAVK